MHQSNTTNIIVAAFFFFLILNMINDYSTIRVKFEVQYIRVGVVLVGFSCRKQTYVIGKLGREIKALISPRYSRHWNLPRLKFANRQRRRKGYTYWERIPPCIHYVRKAVIVLHTDRDRSFVRLDNGDIRNTDIS